MDVVSNEPPEEGAPDAGAACCAVLVMPLMVRSRSTMVVRICDLPGFSNSADCSSCCGSARKALSAAPEVSTSGAGEVGCVHKIGPRPPCSADRTGPQSNCSAEL